MPNARSLTATFVTLTASLSLLARDACAQATPAADRQRPIQDNSFLLEEAYNQEARVVQHISGMLYQPSTREWAYSFTQEWPVRGQRNQFSYTVPLARAEVSPGSFRTGLGDLLLNYRYQLVGSGETRVAIAPRVSLVLPTGDATKGFGRGRAGVQVNAPLSLVLTEQLVTHVNAGFTITPGVDAGGGTSVTLRDAAAGESLIWLAHPNFNVMTEAVWSRTGYAAGGRAHDVESFLLSPGVRGAFNFASGLQVVPGLAVPIEMRGNRATSLFFYLSFEHPF